MAGRGLTLIEVVAGLALMASILTSLLYARTRFARALRNSDERVRACAAADDLLTNWRLTNHATPADGQGDVIGNPRFRWKTIVLPSDAGRQIEATVVRLSIVAVDRPTTPLATVDVLVPPKARAR